VIRPATAADAEALAALWNPLIRDTAVTFSPAEKSPAEIAAMISARPAFLVAEHAGRIAGLATFDQFRAGPGYRHSMEHTIVLAEGARGLGLGRALMAGIEDRARAMGAHVMVAGVSAENPAGRAFHEAIGYRLVGTLPEVGFKFGRWMDLWLLQKLLT
jgi:phosphinothricin acetyltransferase